MDRPNRLPVVAKGVGMPGKGTYVHFLVAANWPNMFETAGRQAAGLLELHCVSFSFLFYVPPIFFLIPGVFLPITDSSKQIGKLGRYGLRDAWSRESTEEANET